MRTANKVDVDRELAMDGLFDVRRAFENYFPHLCGDLWYQYSPRDARLVVRDNKAGKIFCDMLDGAQWLKRK